MGILNKASDWAWMLRLALRDITHNQFRSALTVGGIAVGLAVWLAIQLANGTVLSEFKRSVTSVTGPSNLIIQTATGLPMDEGMLRELKVLWGTEAHYTPLVEGSFRLETSTGSESLKVIGVDVLEQATLPVSLGERPQNTLSQQNFWQSVEPNAIWVSNVLAKEHHWQVDSTLHGWVGDTRHTLTVRGILKTQGAAAFSGVMMDISPAQRLLGLQQTEASSGKIHRIQLVVPEGQVATIQQQLTSHLKNTGHSDVIVTTPEARGTQVQAMVRAFQSNLACLSNMALLVGMFLIYNTLTIAMIRLRKTIGTLRTLGATRVQVVLLFSLQALVLGIVGSALGVGLGIVLALGALQAIGQTVETLYMGQPLSGLVLDVPLLWLSFGLGVAITLLAAAVPMVEAARIAPALTTREGKDVTLTPRWTLQVLWLGLAMLAAGALASRLPTLEHWLGEQWSVIPVGGYAAAFLLLLGLACIIPWVLSRWLLRVLAALMKRLGWLEGRLASGMMLGALGRMSVAVASLMVGIALMVSLAVMIHSFRQTVTTWINQTLRADIWVKAASQGATQQTGLISPAVVQRILTTPGVGLTDRFLDVVITVDGKPVRLGVSDVETIASQGDLTFMNGESLAVVMKRFAQHPNSVMVTETFARKHHRWTGDTVALPSPKGPLVLKIQGVYTDYASEHGYIILPRAVYNRYFNDDGVSNVAVYVDPTSRTTPKALRSRILSNLPANASVDIQTNADLRAEVFTIFNRTFAITYALHAIAMGVALMTVLNTLIVLVRESRREFAILTYIGAVPNQITAIVLVQAGLLALGGLLFGAVAGLGLAWLLITVVNQQSFGWTLGFSFPWDFAWQAVALVLGTSLIAGLLPAWQASRFVATASIREE
ncbi:MAG: FtsX-like permease family protein [Vampirovibrionales bacterium]|nr:FtsX-like permease family protein [Vampirovibrionales bacterium]